MNLNYYNKYFISGADKSSYLEYKESNSIKESIEPDSYPLYKYSDVIELTTPEHLILEAKENGVIILIICNGVAENIYSPPDLEYYIDGFCVDPDKGYYLSLKEYYSNNSSFTWSDVVYLTSSSTSVVSEFNLTEGQKLHLRRKYNSNNTTFSISSDCYTNIKITGRTFSSGDVMSLLYYNFLELEDNTDESFRVIPESYCFCKLFNNSTGLKTSPTLSAKTLKNNCYRGMFAGSSNSYEGLIIQPSLNGSLEEYCYYGMFLRSNLRYLTPLPSLLMKKGAYSNMYYYCNNITTPPKLPATELEDECYYLMFRGCTSLNILSNPKESEDYSLPAQVLKSACYYGMFANCTSLINSPCMKATDLSECWQPCESMFLDCSSLVNVCDFPNTYVICDWAFCNMFRNCTSLVNPPNLNVLDEDGCLLIGNKPFNSTFYGCTSLTCTPQGFGKFKIYYKIPETHSAGSVGNHFLNTFLNCTNLTTGPDELFLKINFTDTYLTSSERYHNMFCNCNLLKSPICQYSSSLSHAGAMEKQLMFYGNKNMNRIIFLHEWVYNGNNLLLKAFFGVSESGIAIVHPSCKTQITSLLGSGWTIYTAYNYDQTDITNDYKINLKLLTLYDSDNNDLSEEERDYLYLNEFGINVNE